MSDISVNYHMNKQDPLVPWYMQSDAGPFATLRFGNDGDQDLSIYVHTVEECNAIITRAQEIRSWIELGCPPRDNE